MYIHVCIALSLSFSLSLSLTWLAVRTCSRCRMSSISSNWRRDGMGSADAGGTGGSISAACAMASATWPRPRPASACDGWLGGGTKRSTSRATTDTAEWSKPLLSSASRPLLSTA